MIYGIWFNPKFKSGRVIHEKKTVIAIAKSCKLTNRRIANDGDWYESAGLDDFIIFDKPYQKAKDIPFDE